METNVNETAVVNGTPDTSAPTTSTAPEDAVSATVDVESLQAEIERLKAKSEKDKATFDKKASELAKKNNEIKELQQKLRANQSADEQKAEEEKERQEAIQEELNNLRKQSALASISKKVFTFVGNEETANEIAEYLYGADDADAAIDAINREWTRLRKEIENKNKNYGAPASGGQTLSPEDERRLKNIQMAQNLGANRAAGMKNADNGLKKYMSR